MRRNHKGYLTCTIAATLGVHQRYELTPQLLNLHLYELPWKLTAIDLQNPKMADHPVPILNADDAVLLCLSAMGTQ